MAGLVQQSRGTVAAGDTTVTFSPERPASIALHNRGSLDLTCTCSPGSVVVDAPAGEMVVINGGSFDSCVLSDGGSGSTTYTLYYGDAESVAALSKSAVAGSISAAEIADGAVSGDKAAVVADDNATPGMVVCHVIAVAGGANANEDITVGEKFEVFGASVRYDAAGGTASTLQLFNGADAITDQLDTSGVSDTDYGMFGQLDDDHTVIAANGTLRATIASGASDAPAAKVFVTCVKRA